MDSYISPWTGVVTSRFCTSDPHITLLTDLALLSSSSLKSERQQRSPVATVLECPFCQLFETDQTRLHTGDHVRRSKTWGASAQYIHLISPQTHLFSPVPWSPLHCLKKKDNHSMTAATWLFDGPPCPPKYFSLSQRFSQVVYFSSDSLCHLNLKQHRMDFFLHPLPPKYVYPLLLLISSISNFLILFLVVFESFCLPALQKGQPFLSWGFVVCLFFFSFFKCVKCVCVREYVYTFLCIREVVQNKAVRRFLIQRKNK